MHHAQRSGFDLRVNLPDLLSGNGDADRSGFSPGLPPPCPALPGGADGIPPEESWLPLFSFLHNSFISPRRPRSWELVVWTRVFPCGAKLGMEIGSFALHLTGGLGL